MKTVIFFRHGKSDWDAPFGHDHERPINKRGQKDAGRMGRFLAEINQLPDRIVTSSAVRARTTVERAAEEGEWGDIPMEISNALYEASPSAVVNVIRSQVDEFERLLLVGHEPTWSGTISRLTGGSSVKVSTGSMSRIDFNEVRWADIDFGLGQLRWLIPPKLVK